MPKKLPSPADHLPVLVERRICLFRGQKVMLDSDLAELYQVPTKRLNEAVRRNSNRFPEDFMFQLTAEELENWRSQIATSNPGAKMGLRRPPYAFTELGVAMLSSVLNSDRAVQMNIVIMRAFVKLREVLTTHKDLARKLEDIERNQKHHASIITVVVEEIKKLKQAPPTPPKRRIGFHLPDESNRALSPCSATMTNTVLNTAADPQTQQKSLCRRDKNERDKAGPEGNGTLGH